MLQTLRKTLTKLETNGYVPGSIWVNPTDFEAVELALSTVNAVEHVGLPYDAAARRLWGAPLVLSTAVAAGVSYTVAGGAVGLNTDGRLLSALGLPKAVRVNRWGHAARLRTRRTTMGTRHHTVHAGYGNYDLCGEVT